eukprot:g2777.t1
METQLCVSTKVSSGEDVFNRYFPEIVFSSDDHRVALFRSLLHKFFSTKTGRNALSQCQSYRDHLSLWLDYRQLESFKIRGLKDALLVSPMEALGCLSAAGHQAMTTYRMKAPRDRLLIRLYNCRHSELTIQSMKASWIGKLVTLTGTVTRLTPSRPLFLSLMYSCTKCGSRETVQFENRQTQLPQKCTRSNCRNRRFQPELQSAVMVDWQKLRISESLPIEKQIHGAVPRTIDVELRDDLINKCRSGDTVTVTGIVKVLNTNTDRDAGANGGPPRDLFLLYLDAISIRNANDELESGDPFQDSTLNKGLTEFSKKDLDFISEFYQYCNGDQLKQLVHAFCPAICGNEVIKAGTLLALVGGVSKQADGTDRVPVRGDIHVLLVGDPGMGKSELLKSAATIAPRGVYVCGNTSSATGLTASVIKDNITGEFTFEAGAMVLAHEGVCCIDEFDRMQNQHQSLLEAMEQQEVSIAKGGLVASLPSKTTVIAAANPADGHYQHSKTLKQNLRIEAPMLSRFDLVYVLIDKPDSDFDQLISEHILSMKTRGNKLPKRQRQGQLRGKPDSERRSLIDSLKQGGLDDYSEIPSHLIQKYLCYARHYIKPRLTNEACDLIKEFYLKLRNANCVADEIPITARQLESLIRIAEARAKIDLRENVTSRDAEDAISLVKAALYDKFIDDQNTLTTAFAQSKKHSRKFDELEELFVVLQNHVASHDTQLISMDEIYSIADDLEIQESRVRDLVAKLNDRGELVAKTR